ncbi:MAG: hypothetical protein JWR90_1376 [Marmoricola sp.]|nr:hypothetical protein [Marmoricola sp.]
MRLLTHPAAQFAAALVVAFVLVASLTAWFSSRAAEREAIADSRSITEVLGQGVVEPALNRGLAYGEPAAVARFDRVIHERLRVASVRRIKLWSTKGDIVYSDDPRLIGRHFALDDEEREVLAKGGSASGISDLSQPENQFDRDSGPVVEVYSRVDSPEGDPLLFEVYYSLADVNSRKAEISRAFRPVTLGGTLVLALLATPLAWWLTRRLRRDAEARERLLQAAAEASDGERRRIARDLHDGVVQNLTGATFALSGTVRSGRPADPEALEQIAQTMRGSLRSLRSLLVEIYPPDLHETGIQGALDDLLAPLGAAGIETDLRVEVSALPTSTAALVWRVAQEAVRNAVRHGSPDRVTVRLASTGSGVRLTVQDDGVGFDAGSAHDPGHDPGDHLGLRAMRDLVREAGGTLHVDSAAGKGTLVQLEVRT